MVPRWPGGGHSARVLGAVLGTLGFAALSVILTRPPRDPGIHDSDSALYIVEAISLSQTSVLDPRPEWNTVVRLAALPWGGMHVLLLRLGLRLCGDSPDGCEFRASCLCWFWSMTSAVSVVLASLLGYLLRGSWGAVWASGLVALSSSHLGLYTQLNQVGTTALFSLLLLVAGASRALRPERRGAAVVLGLVGFLYPFADNMSIVMWVVFPGYIWLLLSRPHGRALVKAIAPFATGTGLALVGMATLTGLRFATGATVYDCTLLHFAGRVVSLLSRSTGSATSAAPWMNLPGAAASLGVGGALAVALAALYAVARVRTTRDLCLVPVALAYAVPLLFVSRSATLVSEYLNHALTLVLLATGVIVGHLWSQQNPGTRRVVVARMTTVACALLMLRSAAGGSGAARRERAGEAWALVGARLSRLPADDVIASTAEEEVGILYTGRRILTRNDTAAQDLVPRLEAWPGRIDYLVIRSDEQDRFAALLARRRLELLHVAEGAGSAEWRVFGPRGDASAPPGRLRLPRAGEICRRQPYIPYSFDAAWRYAPDSVLRTWGLAGLLQGDPRLWQDWSRATRLAYEPFASFDPGGPPATPPPASAPR